MKRAILKRLLFVFAALLTVWPACELFEGPAEKVVLSVGGRNLTREDLRAQLKTMAYEYDRTDIGRLESWIERVVDHYLVLEYGRQRGISVSDEELEGAAREIKKDYAEKDFQDLLLKGFVDYARWKEGLREQLLIRKITKKAAEAIPPVSIEEIKAYYDSHPEEFRRPAMVRFRHIVTSTPEEANKLQKRLAQGGDMAATVIGSSRVPASAGGLEPGWFAKGDLDESIEKVVFSLPVGQVSGVVETPYGFHLFEVLAKKPEGIRSLAEAMPEIEAKLLGEKEEVFYSQWLQELRATIPVTVHRELLKELEPE